MDRPDEAPLLPAASLAVQASAPRSRSTAPGSHSGKVLVAHGHVLNSQSDATVTRLASIMFPITAIAFILVFAMVATHPLDANVHETAAGATLKSDTRVADHVHTRTMPLSADPSTADTVTALSDAHAIHARDPPDRHEPLPVQPPKDEYLQAALEDLAAAHSHAQAAAESQSVDVSQSA